MTPKGFSCTANQYTLPPLLRCLKYFSCLNLLCPYLLTFNAYMCVRTTKYSLFFLILEWNVAFFVRCYLFSFPRCASCRLLTLFSTCISLCLFFSHCYTFFASFVFFLFVLCCVLFLVSIIKSFKGFKIIRA